MARQMAEEGLRKRLEEIDMGEGEWEAYLSYFDRIQTQVQQLRVVLEAIENKSQERSWLRHQSTGELVSVFLPSITAVCV